MPQQTATMAAYARPAQARVEWTEHCLEPVESAPTLSGWRAGLAVAIVATVLVLLALPVLVVLDPPLAGRAAGWLGRLAALVPATTATTTTNARTAVIVVSKSDGRQ